MWQEKSGRLRCSLRSHIRIAVRSYESRAVGFRFTLLFENPEPRLPATLMPDVNGSMIGKPTGRADEMLQRIKSQKNTQIVTNQ
ncbi:hypothetical protein [Hydrogenimonas cancrithermarum]|uniref:hypothetical protein n=1 Tax=Hydrogenimonas cancrithermarum TaxID=2993563 RepID=UPI002573552F|nr:hypothetical protein [Hydrogenimonas cancrithermarum]